MKYLLLYLSFLHSKPDSTPDLIINPEHISFSYIKLGGLLHIEIKDFYKFDSFLNNVFFELGCIEELYNKENIINIDFINLVKKNNSLLFLIGMKFYYHSAISDFVNISCCFNINEFFINTFINDESFIKMLPQNHIINNINMCIETKVKTLYFKYGLTFDVSNFLIKDTLSNDNKDNIIYNIVKNLSFIIGFRIGFISIPIQFTHCKSFLLLITTISSCIKLLWDFIKFCGFNRVVENKKYKNYKNDKCPKNFNDVCVDEEIKSALKIIAEYFKNNQKYEEIGAELPKGILVHGPPGTGKTLLAKTLAGEIPNCNFMAVSAAIFMNPIFGLYQLEEVFREAKAKSPTILFIDELEVLGDRTTPEANRLLTLLDGFDEENKNIFIFGATNNLHQINHALLRSGRFDRIFHLDLPNEKNRLEILKIHTKNRVLDNTVNLEEIAKLTNEFSGADLSTLVNDATLNAINRGVPAVNMQDFFVGIKNLRKKINTHLLTEKEIDRNNIYEDKKKLLEYAEELKKKK